jgi:hypothetical protein
MWILTCETTANSGVLISIIVYRPCFRLTITPCRNPFICRTSSASHNSHIECWCLAKISISRSSVSFRQRRDQSPRKRGPRFSTVLDIQVCGGRSTIPVRCKRPRTHGLDRPPACRESVRVTVVLAILFLDNGTGRAANLGTKLGLIRAPPKEGWFNHVWWSTDLWPNRSVADRSGCFAWSTEALRSPEEVWI